MSKRARSFYCGSSKGTLDMQEKPWFKKRSSNQLLTEYTKARNDSVFSPMSQKGRATSSQNKKPTCGKCSKIIMVIAFTGRTIALCVAIVATNLGMAQM